MNEIEQRLQLPPDWRYRCNGWWTLEQKACAGTVTHAGPDRTRGDALTFWCPVHRPDDAFPIVNDGNYLAIELAVILTLGASTMRREDAAQVARHYVAGILADARIRGTVLGTSHGLMTPGIPIIGQR